METMQFPMYFATRTSTRTTVLLQQNAAGSHMTHSWQPILDSNGSAFVAS